MVFVFDDFEAIAQQNPLPKQAENVAK